MGRQTKYITCMFDWNFPVSREVSTQFVRSVIILLLLYASGIRTIRHGNPMGILPYLALYYIMAILEPSDHAN